MPIVERTKIQAVKWKEWQDKLPPEELVREWFSVRRNIAIVTAGMVVFDCDDPPGPSGSWPSAVTRRTKFARRAVAYTSASGAGPESSWATR